MREQGTCANCGEHTEVMKYYYKANPRGGFYLCEKCFWNLPQTHLTELVRVDNITVVSKQREGTL